MLLREDASQSNAVALMTKTESDGRRHAVFYDAQKLVSSLKAALTKDELDKYEIEDAAFDAIVGMAIIGKPDESCDGAWEINMIAGPGKLVYGVAYAMSPSHKIIPDRSAVSATARDAWKNQYEKNKNKTELDDLKNTKTPDEKDNCNLWADKNDPAAKYLDNAYAGNFDPSSYVGVHKKCLSALEGIVSDSQHGFDFDAKDIVEQLWGKADSFFQQSYRKNKTLNCFFFFVFFLVL